MREAVMNIITLCRGCTVIAKEKDIKETGVSSFKFWVQGQDSLMYSE